jgi:hypothetical protein
MTLPHPEDLAQLGLLFVLKGVEPLDQGERREELGRFRRFVGFVGDQGERREELGRFRRFVGFVGDIGACCGDASGLDGREGGSSRSAGEADEVRSGFYARLSESIRGRRSTRRQRTYAR